MSEQTASTPPDLIGRLRKRSELYRDVFNAKDGIESARWPAKPFEIDATLFEEAATALEDHHYSDAEHEHFGCHIAKTGIYAENTSAVEDDAPTTARSALRLLRPFLDGKPHLLAIIDSALSDTSGDDTNADAQPSTAAVCAGPSQEGLGRGDVAPSALDLLVDTTESYSPERKELMRLRRQLASAQRGLEEIAHFDHGDAGKRALSWINFIGKASS